MSALRAVVLLSGGLDSATTLALAVGTGFECHALSFDYGQRHRRELEAARALAPALGAVRHEVIAFDLRRFGGSALTADIAVPKDRADAEIATGIPVTYVPARNTIFLSFALAFAETLGASDIYIGVTAVDSSGYPDCRPEYIEAFQRMGDLATKAGVEGTQVLTIHTPLIRMTKAEIVETAVSRGVPLALTWSCYEPQPDGAACGRCDSCRLRRRGFADAGLDDPLRYA
ncbi:MAG: 7-cyano-7-deazaguanine synthase QueC [Candidatus Rokubacteria bacterium]|nr:7-cyano-7-deazaguanine synthase QueC [Candidatus Rokubacteria bacterium]